MKKNIIKTVGSLELRPALWFAGACLFAFLLPLTTRSQSQSSAPSLIPGQTATTLADGRLLLLGGESAGGGLDTASIWDPKTNSTVEISGKLTHGRAWHTATVLPDGFILVLGGIGNNNQVVSSVELYDPATQSFTGLPTKSVTGRARHSATLLSDGHVLIAGGVGSNGQTLHSAELWDVSDSAPANLKSEITARQSHSATLLGDGRVLLWGGRDSSGGALDNGELFDPAAKTFTPIASYPSDLLPRSSDAPSLVATIPLDRSVDVDDESIISLRFFKPLKVETVNSNTVSLNGPKGLEKIAVVSAENGTLAFLTPDAPLLPGSTYTVTVNGAVDRDGLSLPLSGISFVTQGLVGTTPPASRDDGTGLRSSARPGFVPQSFADDNWLWRGRLKDGKPYSDWQDLPPLQAPPGVTALSGQVLDLAGLPLANVVLDMEASDKRKKSKKFQTDETGRFLLTNLEPGWQELVIDGRRGRIRQTPQSAPVGGGEDHGIYEYGIDIKASKTTVLPFTIWLTKIDKANAVKLPSPLTTETIITSPKIPGLELRIPANAVIYDHDGNSVEEISLTQIPLDRTPFPLPQVEVPIYFTAQPGGTYIRGPDGIGARIYYPNLGKKAPDTVFNFWHYSTKEKWFYAGDKGWWVYGQGKVAADGSQIVPNPRVSIYELSGAMVGPPPLGPDEGPQPDCDEDCDADPVNLFTGLFMRYDTDLVLPGLMPIKLDRTYRPRDSRSRAFGIGTNHSYDSFIVGDSGSYSYAEIVLPDGARIRYNRISSGTNFLDAVFEHTATPGRFYKTQISWVAAINGWQLVFKDGTRWFFDDGFLASRPGQAGLLFIQDRYGNELSIARDTAGNVTKITSSSGRWIEFTNDAVNNRITQAKDNINRTYSYTYDASGRLWKVTDPENGVTEYLYDSNHNMTSVINPRGHTVMVNEYDANNRVKKQTLANGGTYQFAYTLDGNGKVTQTDVTDPRGTVKRTTFNPTTGYTTSVTRAVGKPEQQVTTYNRLAGTNQKDNVIDALVVGGTNRKTSYTYDAKGNMLTVTRNAQDANPANHVTTTYTYEPVFNQVATITDPLNHTTSFFYDAFGNLERIRDANNNETTYLYNPQGQPISVTTPAGTTQLVYDFGDLVSVIDPLGNVTIRGLDAIGRLQNMTNPLGLTSSYTYDNLSRLKSVIDPLNGPIQPTQFDYDPNNNLTKVTDAKLPTQGITNYTFDNMDRLGTRTDPLAKAESYVYDLNNNLTVFRDRRLQATVYEYDALNRRTKATYADGSNTIYTYDAGSRLTQISDSTAGVITREFDALDRLKFEQTPQGNVTYTYDKASNRKTMFVTGQVSAVVYDYDNANRLTRITQGASIIDFGYDNANRRTSLTLSNLNKVEYTYDLASRITEITYKQNLTTVIGNLTYEYDKAGNRTKIGGTWARTGMPEPITTTSYDANNRQLTFGDKTLSYDDNGNLQSITDSNGTTLYQWNARNQLVGISGPSVNASFVYDGIGRREAKTINGTLTEFLYDGVNPVQETAGTTVLANILPGLGIDEFLTRTDVVAGVTSNFLSDALGSTIAVADSDGNVQTQYAYEAFGKTTSTGVPNSSFYQYTGRENDGTRLYYYRERFYHPELQRFISEDPTGFEVGATSYTYVSSNPVGYVDPLGLDAVYVNYNYYPVDTGYGVTLPLGHAGVVTIDPRTGATRYYEYGRYNRNACGEVVRRPVPDVKISKDGSPTQESLSQLYDFLSTRYGRGSTVSTNYYRDTNFDDANNNAERTKNDRNRPCYDLIRNNCKTFARRIATGG
jgi:RHS repeat-associated protein